MLSYFAKAKKKKSDLSFCKVSDCTKNNKTAESLQPRWLILMKAKDLVASSAQFVYYTNWAENKYTIAEQQTSF